MQKLTILSNKEMRKIKAELIKHFGFFLKEDYTYLINEKGRVFLVNKNLAMINLKNLIVDRIGLYFAEIKNNQVRLSKEGAQLLFKDAQKHKSKLKNVVELSELEVKKYFQGEDLDKDLDQDLDNLNAFILLKYNHDVFGCAKYKEQKIINFLPKIHRGEIII